MIPATRSASRAAPSRRDFLKTAALTGTALLAGCVAPYVSRRRVLGANDRLNIAAVGAGGKGAQDLSFLTSENIVALCDVDSVRLGRQVAKYPGARGFADWRVMFDQLGAGFDAITVSVPDHSHFLPAHRALLLEKHVFCQKPLTHSLWEARTLTAAARTSRVATQMGNQGSAHPKLRRDAELIRAGVLGEIRELHLWTDRPGTWWPQGVVAPTEFPAAPATLDWDLWLGGSAARPYHPAYSHFKWRGWWDFGTGAIGDMGCHLLNCAMLALDVRDPVTVRARGEGATADSGPPWSEIEWQFPARDGKPAWKLFWYDGGRRASRDLFPSRPYGENGLIFVGSKDTFYCPGYQGGGIFKSGARYDDFKSVGETFTKSSIENYERSHYAEWIAACKGARPALSNFDVSGPITEVVLLGTLALRSGRPLLEWDARRLAVTNEPAVNRWVKKEYRKGWGG